MVIQDTLHGALLISTIDFLLSFIIIGGIGVILALFPLLNRLDKPKNAAPPLPIPERASVATTVTAAPQGTHPGLSDQQLVVLLTAAAYTVLGEQVRVEKFRPLTAKDWNWAAQGRSDLQSHRLK